jgi:hypothetical protein
MNIQEITVILIVGIAALWYGRTFLKQFTRQKGGCRTCTCGESDELKSKDN